MTRVFTTKTESKNWVKTLIIRARVRACKRAVASLVDLEKMAPSELQNWGEWFALARPVLMLFSILEWNEEADKLRTWLNALLESVESASKVSSSVFDDWETSYGLWAIENTKELQVYLHRVRDLTSNALLPKCESQSTLESLSEFELTVLLCNSFFCQDRQEEQKCFDMLSRHVRTRFSRRSAQLNKRHESFKGPKRTNCENDMWVYGFLLSHFFVCRARYGLELDAYYDSDCAFLEFLFSIISLNRLSCIPDLLAEVIFCYFLCKRVAPTCRQLDKLQPRCQDSLKILLMQLTPEGSLPLEPSLGRRARLHGLFVFLWALLSDLAFDTSGTAAH